MAERLSIRVSQRQLADLLRIVPQRIEQLTHGGIVHRIDGSTDYDLDAAVGEWLEYERAQSIKSRKKSELERERVRLTRAKAEAAERKLAMLDCALVSTEDIIERVRTVSLRIKSKLQAALPRIARGCYHARNLTEALFKVRAEFDLLIAELSALQEGDEGASGFEVVTDESGEESAQRSTVGEDPDSGAPRV